MRIRLLTAVMAVLVAQCSPVYADPLRELPTIDLYSPEVGNKGTLSWHYGKVLQVLDDDWLVVSLDAARTGRYVGTVLIHHPGIGKNMADGKRIGIGDWAKYLGEPPNVKITSTKRLKSELGGTKTFYVLEVMK